jgi:hypothetical protein
MLMFDPVPGLTNILTLVYEVLSALLATIQCVRSLSLSGSSWKSQKSGLIYLVMQQGVSDNYYMLRNALAHSKHDLGLLYFG